MKPQTNPRASETRSLQRAALLAATATLLASLLTACGGGGDVTSPVPVTPTVTCSGQSTPTVTSASACPTIPATSITASSAGVTVAAPYGSGVTSGSYTLNAVNSLTGAAIPGAVTGTLTTTGAYSAPWSAATCGVSSPPCNATLSGNVTISSSTAANTVATISYTTGAPSCPTGQTAPVGSNSVSTCAAPTWTAATCAASAGAVTATTYKQLVGPNCVTVNRATNTTTGAPNKVSATNLQLIAATLIGDAQWNADVNVGKVLWFELQNLGGGTPTHIVSWYLRPTPFVTPTAANPNPTMACDKPINIATGATPVGQGTSNACRGEIQDFGVSGQSGWTAREYNSIDNYWQCRQKNFDLQGNWAGEYFTGTPAVCTP